LRAQPRFAPALYERAVVLRALGRRVAAAAAFQQFIDVAPNDPRAEDARTSLRELGG
jgi:TolA-binding protein